VKHGNPASPKYGHIRAPGFENSDPLLSRSRVPALLGRASALDKIPCPAQGDQAV